MDIIKYTNYEIRKNLALLEAHLKQAPFGDDVFCEECINKHILILEGLAEEGITATCEDCDEKKYWLLFEFLNKIKDRDYKKQGIEFAREARKIRKEFIPCDEETEIRTKEDINKKIEELEEEKKLAKDNYLKDRLEFGIYLLKWMLQGRKCE